jgi:GH15 family glucan-1,4-alpha-glucosidase
MQGRQVPIGSYGLIGDTRTAALVAPDGAIDWWCAPRFDSPPVFGRLVGGEAAGSFAIAPVDPVESTVQAYRGDTATLVTTWRLAGSEVELTDGLVANVTGTALPGTVLVRQVRVRGRAARVVVRLAARFGYDRRPAASTRRRLGALLLDRGSVAIAVTTSGPRLEPEEDVVIEVGDGEVMTIVVTVTRHGPAVIVPPAAALAALDHDERFWSDWSRALDVPFRRDVVTRSLLTLRLLTYSPSGAPVAAPTTSLPEWPGGTRNWDYRFAWPRDASIGIGAFLGAGRTDEARRFLWWLLHASRLARPRLPVLFTLDGHRGTEERTLPGWPGYAGSVPVRVGNGAAEQHQLDGYGWVLDAAWLLTSGGHRLYPETWRTMAGFADHVAQRWRDPDAGIWEKRDDPAHHVHSKLMAWAALDRAVRIAEARGDRRVRRTRRWATERDLLAAQIRERGCDPALGVYTAAYDTTELDAAVLLLPVLEFEPAGSAHARDTVDAIRQRLSAGGPLVYRYPPGTDGLAGPEGAFLPCSFWLVQALAATGRRDEAVELFDELVELGGPLWLFGEEAHPATGEQLGNFPQALTHAALVQAAAAIGRAGESLT